LRLQLAYFPDPCVLFHNQSLTRHNAHLQECGNDCVGAPDGHPRLISDSYGFAVLSVAGRCLVHGRWSAKMDKWYYWGRRGPWPQERCKM
jgi:hypothetical protein